MMKNLCLKNSEGKVVRWIPVNQVENILVVRAPESQRLAFRPAYEKDLLETQGWEILKEMSCKEAMQSPIAITPQLSLASCDTEEVVYDPAIAEEDKGSWKRSALASLALGLLFVFGMINMPAPSQEETEEEQRQEVVKIIKKQKPQPMNIAKPTMQKTSRPTPQPTKVAKPKVKSTKSIKRMGALAALGSKKSGKQKGGLDLGAVKKSAGIGRGGGTQGSGGVQTSIYAKGIVSAPTGVGGNMQGAGGVGTKGKGGGQAGYGELSLKGSAGTSVIPVGQEVIEGGGLDQSLIWDVIRKNQGQITFCYEQGLQSDPKLKGRVTTAFTIGSNGRVTSLNIADSTLNSKIVEDCIALRMKTWKFPLPENGKAVSVKVPFNLNRQGRG